MTTEERLARQTLAQVRHDMAHNDTPFTRWYWGYLCGVVSGGVLMVLLLAFLSLGR